MKFPATIRFQTEMYDDSAVRASRQTVSGMSLRQKKKEKVMRFMASAFILLAVVVAGILPRATLEASTVQGTAITISGLDDLSATVDQQARKGGGKILSMLLGVGGLITIGTGHHYVGAAGVGAGLGTAFIPGIMSSAFDAAPAATATWAQPGMVEAWWAPLTAGLYPVFLLWRLLQDPVFLCCVVLVLIGMRLSRLAAKAGEPCG